MERAHVSNTFNRIIREFVQDSVNICPVFGIIRVQDTLLPIQPPLSSAVVNLWTRDEMINGNNLMGEKERE